MYTKFPASMKVFFTLLLVTAFLFTGIGASAAQDVTDGEVEVISPHLSLIHRTASDGKALTGYLINGPSQPPAGYKASDIVPNTEEGTIANFPSFSWVFGCSAVSGAMIATYYDRNGYPKMYEGPTNGGVMPLTDTSWATWSDGYTTYPNNPLIASHKNIDGRTTKGSIDDYWIKYGSTASDPYITGSWTQHTWGTAIGDYMKTSQSAYGNSDGSTVFYNWTTDPGQLTCADMVTYNITVDGTYGRKLFYEKRGYTVTDCYNQKTDNNSGGFTLAKFKAEIDAKRPVLLNLAGHSIVGYGYDGTTIYIRDTWDNDPSSTHTMTWGGSYSGMDLLSVSIVNLKAATTTVPVLKAPVGTITDKTPTYKFTPVKNATKYQFRTYKGTATTPVYTIDVASSACTTTVCTKTPTAALVLASYKWQARAYVGGVWKAWSAKKAFTVAAPVSGFYSPFTDNATGWSKVSGTWNVAGGYYKSVGLAGTGSSVVHVNKYPTMTYTVRAKRTTDYNYGANRVIIRGTTTPLDATNWWYKGYVFQWVDAGSFSVYKSINGVNTAIKSWTDTTVINNEGWNLIKVTASGSTLKFFINGTLVWSGSDSSLSTGQVGIGFYRDSSETATFLVDYAKLATSVSAADLEAVVVESGIEHPEWTSMDYAGPVE